MGNRNLKGYSDFQLCFFPKKKLSYPFIKSRSEFQSVRVLLISNSVFVKIIWKLDTSRGRYMYKETLYFHSVVQESLSMLNKKKTLNAYD